MFHSGTVLWRREEWDGTRRPFFLFVASSPHTYTPAQSHTSVISAPSIHPSIHPSIEYNNLCWCVRDGTRVGSRLPRQPGKRSAWEPHRRRRSR